MACCSRESKCALIWICLLCDAENLSKLFKRFGFVPDIHKDLTADKITETLKKLSERDFSKEDALVRDF